MKKKALFIAIGAILTIGTLVLGGRAIMQNPQRIAEKQEALSEVVFLEEPEVLPENEGKIVVAYGTITAEGNDYDSEYDISFNYPIVRKVKYAYTWEKEEKKNSDDETTYKAEWVKLNGTALRDSAMIGDFEIGRQYFEQLRSYQQIPKEELEQTNLVDLHNMDLMGSTVYSEEELPTARHGETFPKEDKEGFSYEYLDPETQVTVVGVQTGNELIVTDAYEEYVYEEQKTREDFEEDIENNSLAMYAGIGMFLIIGLALLVYGFIMKKE